MLKKIFIPLVLILIGVTIGAIFWNQHGRSQEPVKVYKAIEVERPTTPKSPPPGETAESGHWHGDVWHAEAHTPIAGEDISPDPAADIALAAYEASLSHYTEEERATYHRALRGEIVRHREKYPDCQDKEAVFEDADRFSRWYLSHKKWREEREKLSEEWLMVLTENDDFYDNFYLNMSADERKAFLKNMSDADRASLIAKLKDSEERSDAAFKKLKEFDQEEPIEPKPRHTH